MNGALAWRNVVLTAAYRSLAEQWPSILCLTALSNTKGLAQRHDNGACASAFKASRAHDLPVSPWMCLCCCDTVLWVAAVRSVTLSWRMRGEGCGLLLTGAHFPYPTQFMASTVVISQCVCDLRKELPLAGRLREDFTVGVRLCRWSAEVEASYHPWCLRFYFWTNSIGKRGTGGTAQKLSNIR